MMIHFKNLSRVKIFHLIIGTIIALLLLLLAFQAGRFIGFRQAMFSGHLGDNYFRAFEGPDRGPLGLKGPRGFMTDDLPNGHGAAGKIIKINLPTLVVVGPDNLERVIKIEADTMIRRFRDAVKPTDLKVGDFIIAVGGDSNDDSQIETKLIRLLPPPPARASSTPKQ